MAGIYGGGYGSGIFGRRASFKDMSDEHQRMALNAYGMMRPNSKQTIEKPDPTLGGALMSGLGAGLAGMEIGGGLAKAGTIAAGTVPWLASGAGLVGLLSHALS